MIGSQSALARPAWDTADGGYTISMAAANRAQALLYLTPFDGPDVLATPSRITVVAGIDGLAAAALMGLTRVPDIAVLKTVLHTTLT